MFFDGSVNLFQNVSSGFREEEFYRISLKSTQCKKPTPPPASPTAAMFFDGLEFREQFLKRVTQRPIGPAVSEEKIFKEFLKRFHLVAMATGVFDGI